MGQIFFGLASFSLLSPLISVVAVDVVAVVVVVVVVVELSNLIVSLSIEVIAQKVNQFNFFN